MAMKSWRRFSTGICSLVIASLIWLPVLSLFLKQDAGQYFQNQGISPKARMMLARHLQIWNDPLLRSKEVQNIRASNPEWDFMWRTFFAWSLVNAAMRDVSYKPEALRVVDEIIDETLSLYEKNGVHYFLMNYSRRMDFVMIPPRSIFIEGEIALMIGMRRLLEEKEEYKAIHKRLIEGMAELMSRGPVMSAESYPDECWMFCNTVALAAIRIADVLDGTDHSKFFARWVGSTKKKLVDVKTGLLVAAYTLAGQPIHGPEGSTIWMAAHCLQLVDNDFASDQYERAKKWLYRNHFGFGYSREWPLSWYGRIDIDSGGVISLIDISPSASGFAMLAAQSFRDASIARGILPTLRLGGFPLEEQGKLKFEASNLVGDAVMLYAMVEGPVWERALQREKTGRS